MPAMSWRGRGRESSQEGGVVERRRFDDREASIREVSLVNEVVRVSKMMASVCEAERLALSVS